MESWIEKCCRKRAIRLLMGCCITVVIIAGLVASNGDYWGPFFNGPALVGATDLDKVNPFKIDHPYVTALGDQVIDSGVQELTTETTNGVKGKPYVSAGYYALLIGNKILMIKSAVQPPVRPTGELGNLPDDLSSQLFSNDEDGKKIRDITYPLLLTTEDDYRQSGYWAITGILVGLAVCIYFGRLALRRLQGKTIHPTLAKVRGWGDVNIVSAEIERELQHNTRFKHGATTITDDFLVIQGLLVFELYRLDDAVWLYKKRTRHYTNLIPTGSTFEAVLVFYGGRVGVSGKQSRVDEMLAFAANRSPWAIAGYTDEINELFKKDPNGFAAVVESRRPA